MKKVGIVSCYFKNNYGSVLQAYATKKILDNNNILNETISVDANKDFSKGKKRYYLSQITNFKFIKGKFGMVKLKLDKKLNKELGKNIAIRNCKYKEFQREFNLSKACTNYKDLTDMAKERYTDVIVGSDQLWLPVNVVSDYYTLNWVPDEINKISYSTSFGFSIIPKKYNELYSKFLNRINHLSTREQSGVKIIKDIANIDAKIVCDPTLLLTKEEWKEVETEEKKYNENYILCYFLGNNVKHRKFAEKLRDETGYKIVSLNHADEYVKYSDTFCDYAPFDIGPKEWISLIENAKYVLTDSFHGTVFSLLFNKTFFNFRRMKANSKVSTNSRIDSLLTIAGVSTERILSGDENPKDVLKYKIDYDKVNENLAKFREDSKNWLLSSLTWKNENCKHIDITSKEDCCGCTACKSICPVGAIEMVEDEEGFKYPQIDKKKCTKCGACKMVCPIINLKKEKQSEQKGYVINNKDLQVRKESTSGGAFSAIAKYVIEQKGVVYGAAFDENWIVTHQVATTDKEIKKFRNSKYVQSDMTNTFLNVKNYLNNKKMVCFSGTPCQVEGLKSYLEKSNVNENEFDNLILVDVVCRAVPSPKLFRNYISLIKKNNLDNEDINKIYFRDKTKYGYKYTQMKIASQNKVYQEGIDTDQYLRAFFSGMSIRPSCENCQFKKRYRESDITIWDCFNIEDLDKSLADNNGTTRVLIHTKKGQEIFEKIKKQLYFKEINSDIIVKGTMELTKSTRYNNKRHEFLCGVEEKNNENNIERILNTYFPINTKTKLEKLARRNLVGLSFYNKIKKIGKKVLGR